MREDKLVCCRHYVVQERTRGQTEGLGPYTWGLYTTGVSLSHNGVSWNESWSGVRVESEWSQVELSGVTYDTI